MKILICGLLHIPNGDAGAIRQHEFSLMLQKMGHRVLMIGMGKANGMVEEVYRGTTYISLRQVGNRFKDKVLSHLLYWSRLLRIMDDFQPDAVLVDDLGTIKMLLLKHYCQKRDIMLIHDSVEWYSPEQFRQGRFSLTYIKKDILNRYLIDSKWRVIAISRYLQRHFEKKGCACIRLPIVISQEDLCEQKMLPDDRIVFAYAGQPGKKDYLHVMLEAFTLLPQKYLEQIVFHIVGCTQEQMIEAGIRAALIEKLKSRLIIHGRVSHSEVLDILKGAHFTILMRSPEQRYAKAGFPTKVVESLSHSTPVICNLTSDLGNYLTDGHDALIVQECSAQSLNMQIRRAIDMTKQKREKMCCCAYETAKTHFLFERYLDDLKRILI